MIRSFMDSRVRGMVMAALLLIGVPAMADAQAVGSGPLTSSLATKEPTAGTLRLGPARIAPGVVVREAGWDSNIFNEPVDPKEDYVIAVAPDASAFMRLPMVQVST